VLCFKTKYNVMYFKQEKEIKRNRNNPISHEFQGWRLVIVVVQDKVHETKERKYSNEIE